MLFTKILLIATLVIAFLSLFLKADFINIIIPMYILMVSLTSLNQSPLEYLNSFLVLIGITLCSDLLWVIFHDSVI